MQRSGEAPAGELTITQVLWVQRRFLRFGRNDGKWVIRVRGMGAVGDLSEVRYASEVAYAVKFLVLLKVKFYFRKIKD